MRSDSSSATCSQFLVLTHDLVVKNSSHFRGSCSRSAGKHALVRGSLHATSPSPPPRFRFRVRRHVSCRGGGSRSDRRMAHRGRRRSRADRELRRGAVRQRRLDQGGFTDGRCEQSQFHETFAPAARNRGLLGLKPSGASDGPDPSTMRRTGAPISASSPSSMSATSRSRAACWAA